MLKMSCNLTQYCIPCGSRIHSSNIIVFRILVIRICFGSRASNFGFIQALMGAQPLELAPSLQSLRFNRWLLYLVSCSMYSAKNYHRRRAKASFFFLLKKGVCNGTKIEWIFQKLYKNAIGLIAVKYTFSGLSWKATTA